MVQTTSPIRSNPEHVGSFLRPDSVHEARDQFLHEKISAEELRKVEDEAIKALVAKQEEVGLQSVSDGEFRREYFHLDFLKHLGGIEVKENKLVGEKKEATPPQLAVVGKVEWIKPIQVDDYKFVQDNLKNSRSSVKVAIPSPTMAHFRLGRAGIDNENYPDLAEFYADLAKAYQQEIAALAEAGCKHIQLDDTNLAYLCSQEMRDAATERGEDVNELPRQYVKLINEALKLKPADMTASVHLCRGNFRSRHFASGGYEPVAEILFGELEVDNFLLEWDDERSGGLEPLRFLPKDGKKRVVLGLVSTKTGKLEDKSKVVERIREAAKFAPLEQLGMGPQCGFASTHHGNELTEEEQWKKIQLCNEIVEEVWGKQA
ncbi:hypothetical protein QFC20_003434 [Naganishia adeliensis]|uniref:Uncharacterized protein n=1 Tax=Naganishia adeliensis TaxID=92952 RepID=A0ACC2WAU8_9TREE|nr:hypothetical protein QFC20_003434 [Naganishia adeliensis]